MTLVEDKSSLGYKTYLVKGVHVIGVHQKFNFDELVEGTHELEN
jgi:hypothetical protein